MKRSAALTVPAAAVIGALLLAGCQGQEPHKAGETSAVPHGHVEGAEEAEEPQLRLAVGDAKSGSVSVVDLLSAKVVETVSGSSGTTLSGADGRYLYLGDYEGGTVTIVDSGVWTVDHGDHQHFYSAEPKVIGELSGQKPAHIVSKGTQAAVFFDGDGHGILVDRADLDEGRLGDLETVAPGAHHGVAVPIGDQVLTTVPGSAPDDLPSSLTAFDASGRSTALDIECPDIHGTAVAGGHTLLACAKGVISVDEKVAATLTPYPEEFGEDRAWTLATGRDLAAAPLGPAGIAILDSRTNSWVRGDTEAEVIAVGIAPDDSAVVAVDVEGRVSTIDPETAEVTARKEAIAAVEPSEGGGHGRGPAVAVEKERTYVSDPAAGTVVELDHRDGLRQARTFDVGGAPAALAVTGR